MPPSESLLVFALASVVLAITPGPGVFYIMARSLAEGRRAGLASVAGVAAGNLVNALGASLGLAGLLKSMPELFLMLRFAGAAYLAFLGVQALRRANWRPGAETLEPKPVLMIVRDGFLVAVLNPKTALFFAAFLPQFVEGTQAPEKQTVLLGALFVLIASVSDTLYALLASAAQSVLTSDGAVVQLQRVEALIFFGIAGYALVRAIQALL